MQSLNNLDPEQKQAALTNGRVLVAAGAGSGKSTTLSARLGYLVNDLQVNPGRIMVTAFNVKAAADLKLKVENHLSSRDAAKLQMGTMHSLFRDIVAMYGNTIEKQALGLVKGPSGFMQDGLIIAYTVQKIWTEHLEDELGMTPNLRTMWSYKSSWAGNNIDPEFALRRADNPEIRMAAHWYAIYECLKGNYSRGLSSGDKQGRTYLKFHDKYLSQVSRLADFDDILIFCNDILLRSKKARKELQAGLDHILIDEAQDLNAIQSSIVHMLAEHIKGKTDKSFWLVGDENQCINEFRGSDPRLFTGLSKNKSWTLKKISTNYRCPPHLVDSANKLIAHNPQYLKLTCKPREGRTSENCTVKKVAPETQESAAFEVVEMIKRNHAEQLNSAAVLCRMNSELHHYETACILRGVPYFRKGSAGFLASFETKVICNYLRVILESEEGSQEEALASVLMHPNKFFLNQEVLAGYLDELWLKFKPTSAFQAMLNNSFLSQLAAKLAKTNSGWKYEKTVTSLLEVQSSLKTMHHASQSETYRTSDLISEILSCKGVTGIWNSKKKKNDWVTITLRESIIRKLNDSDSEGLDPGESAEQLGCLQIMYELCKPDPTEASDLANNPNQPYGFMKKLNKLMELGVKLRSKTENDCLYLGTVHSAKGAEWDSVYLQMPKNVFPFNHRKINSELTDQRIEELMESERRLAYVGLTRSKQDLTLICPQVIGNNSAGDSSFLKEAQLYKLLT